jgi:hypothetical protein
VAGRYEFKAGTTRGAQELGEWGGEAVERLPVQLELFVRDVVGGLGAFGQPFDVREWQRHELD